MKETRLVFFRGFISRYPKFIHTCLVLISFFLTSAFCEYGFRLYLRVMDPVLAGKIQKHISAAAKETTAVSYSPHPYLSYVRSDTVYRDGGIQIGQQFFPRQKNPNIIRVACLGGSTTMNQYPRFLRDDLERIAPGKFFEVMDFGCVGWTVMESMVNDLIRVADFKPDIVLVHHGINDVFPRMWPDFQPDYAHYRLPWQDQSTWIDSKFLTPSWLFSYLQIKRRVGRTDLQNYTVKRRTEDELSDAPPPQTSEVYRKCLEQLVVMIQAQGGLPVLAPMAYRRGLKSYQTLVEEQNQITRRIAEQNALPLAETDRILQRHSELFLDLVHLTDLGNQIKSVVYAKVLWYAWQKKPVDSITADFLHEEDVHPDFWGPRSIQISWNIPLEDIADYHLYVRNGSTGPFVYLAHTADGNAKSFTWKSNARFLDPRLARGPAPGEHYSFQIYAITHSGNPAHYGPYSGPEFVQISEK